MSKKIKENKLRPAPIYGGSADERYKTLHGDSKVLLLGGLD
jgi:hypothetical protein